MSQSVRPTTQEGFVMPSIRSRVFRLILKTVVVPKFRKAGSSVEELRKLAEELGKRQRVPKEIDVQTVEIGRGVQGEWITPVGAAADSAILYLHGGGFVMGSPATHRELAARIAMACRCRVFVVDYRLAPEHPFPSAVEDTVESYQWLLETGLKGERIAMGGDSAGGSLALQSAMALRDLALPLPCSVFLMSPQTDWLHFDGESYSSRADRDPWVTEEMCRFFASLYIGGSTADQSSLSLSTMNLSGLPPMLIQVGDCEVLLSDSTRLARFAGRAGIDVRLEVWPGMWHAFQTSAGIVPEARRAIAGVGTFVESHLAGRAAQNVRWSGSSEYL
jgi:acetyl esterase/lipase